MDTVEKDGTKPPWLPLSPEPDRLRSTVNPTASLSATCHVIPSHHAQEPVAPLLSPVTQNEFSTAAGKPFFREHRGTTCNARLGMSLTQPHQRTSSAHWITRADKRPSNTLRFQETSRPTLRNHLQEPDQVRTPLRGIHGHACSSDGKGATNGNSRYSAPGMSMLSA